MPPLTLICSHCGSEHLIAQPVTHPDANLRCVVCGHEASCAQWLIKTERAFAAMTRDRMKDVSRQR